MIILSLARVTKACALATGVVAGLVLPPLLKSETVREATVSVVAKGMSLKDSAKCAIETIKEEAADVYSEAKNKKSQDESKED